MKTGDLLRDMADWAQPVVDKYNTGSKERIASAAAVGLVRLIADLLDQGNSLEEVIKRLKGAPSLRDEIEEDRIAEDEFINRKPRRS